MVEALEHLARDFDPRRDLQDVKLYNHIHEDNIRKKAGNQLNNLWAFRYLPKHVARGALVGSLAGAAISMAVDYPMGEGARDGVILGAYIDVHQYMFRVFVQYFWAQLK